LSEGGSIGAKALRGAGWVMGWRMATRLLGLISTLILVRILTPADFGLIALATAFAASIDAMSAIGTDYALIREKNPDRALYDTAFTMNLIRGAATSVVIVLAAWPVAWFMDEPRLGAVLAFVGIAFMLSAFENIGIVDFRRTFDFGKEFVLFLVPRIIGIVANIVTALALRSYWALVVGIFVTRVCRMAFSYVMHPYRPRLSLAAWRHLFGFSFWLWANSLVALVRERSDTLVLGRMLETDRVGLFSIGSEIALLPTTEILEPASRTLYPGFAATAHAGDDMGEAYLRALGAVLLLVLPAGFGISLLADPLVKLALGWNWLDAIPIVQIIALTGMFHVIIQTGGNVFGVRGETRLLFRMSLLSALIRVPLLVLLVSAREITGAAYAVFLVLASEAALYAVMTARRLGIGVADYVHHIWRAVLASLVMAAALSALDLGWTAVRGEVWEMAVHMLATAVLGALIYGATVLAFWHAAGRPPGAESFLLRTAGAAFSRLRGGRQ
jgi:O-antigen/teichoic acid export membrane protein